MNIAEAFVEYMEDLSMGTLGSTIYINSVPQEAPDACWWVVKSGGSPVRKNSTGERVKDYTLSIYYRDTDAEQVYELMQDFEEEINSKGCIQLDGYDTIEMEASILTADQDLDNEDRVVGLISVRISVYQNW